MKLAARGLVVAAVIACIIAVTSAGTVLSHGSGTYFAILVFTPILLLPGVLVWLRPHARSLALWAVWSAIGGITYAILGWPYRYERERMHWPWVAWSIGGAIAIAVCGSVVLAFIMAARSRDPLPPSTRALRIQRVTSLSVAVAAISIVLQFVVFRRDDIGAAVFLGLMLLLVVAPAPLVHRRPHRAATLLWALWSSPFSLFIGSIMLTENLGSFAPREHLLFIAYGTLALLLAIVQPVVAFASRDEYALVDPDRQDLPEARTRS